MNGSAAEDWRALLLRLSSSVLSSDQLREYLTGEMLSTRWCGLPPATLPDITAAEGRLGASLPPSYRAFLSASNPNALLAHEAALAAGAQGKFWEMHDTLFENQTKLTRADLLGYAKSLGLDLVAFERALDNHAYRLIVERDLAEAAALSVTTTPTFFVNGHPA
jgi:hypothetical protein